MRRGLPPVSDRTLLAAYQRVLARSPDAEAQADEAGSVTFAGSYERSLRLAAGTEDEIKAVVVAQEGQHVDPVELTRFLVDRLPYFMVPRYLEFAAELPKTPTQKVHKHLLRDRGVGPDVWDREAAGIVLRRAAQ